MKNKVVKSAPYIPGPTGGGGGMQRTQPKVYPKLGAWNRLEGRPRTKDFDRVLSVEVHDALWMLTRQWQFGEFKGEDTGAAIKAKVACTISPVSRYAPGSQPGADDVSTYNNEVPIEALVECEPIIFDLKTHLQITKYWKRLLLQEGVPSNWFDFFLSVYPFEKPTFGSNQVQEKANYHSDSKAVAVYAMAHKRIMNGADFYNAIKNTTDIKSLYSNRKTPVLLNSVVLNTAATKFKNWFSELYVQPKIEKTAWHPNKLEYQFAQAVNIYGEKIPLVSEEYYHGHLDWYAYDVNRTSSDFQALKSANLTNENTISEEKEMTLIPVEAQFAGMPSSRWWELEDSVVNFGNIDASTTDVAKILLAEFGLLYAHEWQIIPFRLPVGHYSKISKIEVTDVFGQVTEIESANKDASEGWSFFFLDNHIKDNYGFSDTGLLLPSTLLNVQESKPIELVHFQRDEMANMVWGIENTIPGAMGDGRNGYEAFLFRQEYLGLTSEEIEEANTTFVYQFIAEDNIPDNWIPFIPVKLNPAENNREVQLLRGAIEKRLNPQSNNKLPVKPFGTLLTAHSAPYFIHEEEVPRSGIEVSRSYQRTRWINGKVFTWLGRRKKTGRGEVSSGLSFDKIK